MSEENQIVLADVLKKAEKRFEEVAPPGILFESEYSYAIQLFNNNSFLKQAAETHPQSALSAMMNVASIGS